jgi:hypothetical protein
MTPRRTTTEFNPSEMVQYLRYYLSMDQQEKNHLSGAEKISIMSCLESAQPSILVTQVGF